MSNEDFNCNISVGAAQQSQEPQDTIVLDGDDDLENNTSTIDTSIMDKVKSRVSGILPNSFSKWFSANKNHASDEDNNNSKTPLSRRRQRSELEADYDYEDEDENDNGTGNDNTNEENNMIHRNAHISRSNISPSCANDHEVNENYTPMMVRTTTTTIATSSAQPGNLVRNHFNSKGPPSKRTRLNDQLENTSINPLEERMPLYASTPAVDNSNAMQRNNNKRDALTTARSIPNRSKFLNLYSNEQNVREPGYNFQAPTDNADDIISSLRKRVSSLESTQLGTRTATATATTTTTTTTNKEQEEETQPTVMVQRRAGILDLKRKKLDSFSTETQSRSNESKPRLTRSSAITTTIEDDDETSVDGGGAITTTKFNGNSEPGVPNGGGEDSDNEHQSECDNDVDELRGGSRSGSVQPNMSRTSSFGNGLNFFTHLEGRKSLFSNLQESQHQRHSNRPTAANLSLNNSTLSLTSLNRRKFNASIYGSTSALSDSRLLNINSPFYKGNTAYGGAASYSRYNYKKLGNSGMSNSSQSLCTMRTLPTQIRPTSSLSSLSASSCAAAAASNASSSGNAVIGKDTNVMGGESNISNTAKRILDLINDFTTPLNEAKKMASNSRALNHSQNSSSSKVRRLNDSDIQNTRNMRLSRVQKPYLRSAVTLHPNDRHNNNVLPPVRELQVPSMSQLMQMKKLQNTTERSRQLTNNNATTIGSNQQQPQFQFTTTNNSDHRHQHHQDNNTVHETTDKQQYKLPTEMTNESPQQEQPQQQRHTGKMKNKICTSARATGSKAAQQINDDYSEMPPVSLPNIAFPLMKSMPKFDIQMPHVSANATSTTVTPVATSTTANQLAPKSNFFTENVLNAQMNKTPTTSSTLLSATNNATTIITTTTPKPTTTFSFTTNSKAATNSDFVFSSPQPLNIEGMKFNASYLDTNNNNNNNNNEYKFSAPIFLNETSKSAKSNELNSVSSTLQQQGELLNKTNTTNSADVSKVSDVWSMAKMKTTSEWECDACMLRNKPDLVNCIACQTPRKNKTTKTTSVTNDEKLTTKTTASTSTSLSSNSFGNAFKRKTDMWECPTCMINNKSSDAKCVACQTDCPNKRIAVEVKQSSAEGLTPTSNSFQFGFNAISKTSTSNTPTTASATSTANNNNDSLFKSLVTAQKSSKWECDACMTRNDTARSKCVCCEQARPGAVAETSSDQNSATTGPKFSFGQTATSKFTFGFANNTANATTTITPKPTTTTTTMPVSTTTAPAFTFGLNKDVADSKTILSSSAKTTTTTATTSAVTSFGGFKFGVTNTSSTTTATATPTTSTLGTSGPVFGQKPMVAAATVKFTLPTSNSSSGVVTSTSDATKPLNNETSITTTATTSSMANSSKPSTVGFGFGNINNVSTTGNNTNSSNISTIGFGTAVSSTSGTFGFGTSAITTPATKSETTTNNLFGMAAQNTAKTTTSTSLTATSTTTTTSGTNNKFTFGTNVTSSSNIFGAAGNNNIGLKNATTLATTNTAGGASSFPSLVSSSFGSSATTTTTVASSSSSSNAFSLATGSTSSNLFGTFKTNNLTNPTLGTAITTGAAASTSLFGQALKPIVAAAAVATTGTTNTQQFVFGQSNNTNNTTTNNNNNNSNIAVVAANSSSPTTNNSWPKNNFVFGGNATQTTTASNKTNNSNAASSDGPAAKSLFGGFGAVSNLNSSTASGNVSLFGNTAPPVATSTNNNNTGPVGFGVLNSSSPKPNFGSSNIFSNSLQGTVPTTAIFGSKAFGSDTTPKFGSSPSVAKTSTFGAFGGNNNNQTTTTNTETKKTETPMFNFGNNASTAPQNNVFGGNVGAAVKPAFNFTPINQPAFNFTATTEQQQQQQQQPQQQHQTAPAVPFQFGAISAAPPVYNFSAGNAEQTNVASSAPFQFNAIGASAPTNMFAPNPSPGVQSAQQARRKIRTPVRRLPPR